MVTWILMPVGGDLKDFRSISLEDRHFRYMIKSPVMLEGQRSFKKGKRDFIHSYAISRLHDGRSDSAHSRYETFKNTAQVFYPRYLSIYSLKYMPHN